MSNWDESHKFKYESIRMLVIAIAGFLAAITIVQPWENSVEYSSFLEKEKIRIKKEIIDSFLKTSYLYSSSIYKVMSNDSDLSRNDEVKLYESNYRKYRVNLNRIIIYFKLDESKNHYSLVKRSNHLRYKLRQMYKNEIDKKDWEILRYQFKSTNNKIAKLALHSIGL